MSTFCGLYLIQIKGGWAIYAISNDGRILRVCGTFFAPNPRRLIRLCVETCGKFASANYTVERISENHPKYWRDVSDKLIEEGIENIEELFEIDLEVYREDYPGHTYQQLSDLIRYETKREARRELDSWNKHLAISKS